MSDQRQAQHSLEAAICRDLGRSTAPPTEPVVEAALGPASGRRFGAITTGRAGRDALLDILERSRAELDSHLSQPAPWRGASRRAHRHGRAEQTAWLGPAFEDVRSWAVDTAKPLALEDLLRWNVAAGGPGAWRTGDMRVDGHKVPFSAYRSLDVVVELLARCNNGHERAEAAAARVHIGILLAHPMRDGNGRTARLAAAAVLMRAGAKSSLLTCVEQHYHATPARYWAALRRLRAREISIDDMLDDLLGAMASRSALAAWMRQRHRTLLRQAIEAGDEDPAAAVRNFELDEGPSSLTGRTQIEPWHRLRPFLAPNIAAELRSQLGRAMSDG